MLSKLIMAVLPKMPERLIWIFSKKYIISKHLDETIIAARKLNNEGYSVTIDLLGEFITELKEAEENKNEYLEILHVLHKNKINGGVSVKPTFFGLLLDKKACFRYLEEVVKQAHEYGIFVRIDMEDSQCTDCELDIYEKLHPTYPKTVGLVLQAYLLRTELDIDRLLKLNTEDNPLNIRLCKGIYNEEASIAYQEYHEINYNFITLLDKLLYNQAFVGIATHDKKLIKEAYKLLEKYKVKRSNYEFQMLYGVEHKLRKSIHNREHPLKVYLPYGQKWLGYSLRRLKENPKMVRHIAKAFFAFK